MMTEDQTEAAEAVSEVEELLETEGSTETDELDNSDEETETEEAEPETVEVERDGKLYRIPAELKDDFLRQGDYTRKTQELAATRKELEAAKERVQQAGEAEVNARARAVAIDAALKQYDGVDWDALEQRDPQAAMRHWRQFSQLRDAKAEADTEYQSAIEARTLETQREAEKRIEQGLAELQRDIPDWGPQKAEQLMTFGEKQFGFSRDYMESVTDPNLVKVMNFAFLAANTRSKTAQQPQVQPKPAAKVQGGSAPRKGLDDRLSAEEWVKQRNEQLSRKPGR